MISFKKINTFPYNDTFPFNNTFPYKTFLQNNGRRPKTDSALPMMRPNLEWRFFFLFSFLFNIVQRLFIYVL